MPVLKPQDLSPASLIAGLVMEGTTLRSSLSSLEQSLASRTKQTRVINWVGFGFRVQGLGLKGGQSTFILCLHST